MHKKSKWTNPPKPKNVAQENTPKKKKLPEALENAYHDIVSIAIKNSVSIAATTHINFDTSIITIEDILYAPTDPYKHPTKQEEKEAIDNFTKELHAYINNRNDISIIQDNKTQKIDIIYISPTSKAP